MEIVILPDAKAIGALGADAITNLLLRKPDAVLGLATGSSPLAIYDELTARCAAGTVSFGRARGFTLDEYVGLPAEHPETYRNVIDRDFVSRVDFAPGAVRGPDGLATDIPQFCAGYEAAMTQAGGVDLQILGIGTVGHIEVSTTSTNIAMASSNPRRRSPAGRFGRRRVWRSRGHLRDSRVVDACAQIIPDPDHALSPDAPDARMFGVTCTLPGPNHPGKDISDA